MCKFNSLFLCYHSLINYEVKMLNKVCARDGGVDDEIWIDEECVGGDLPVLYRSTEMGTRHETGIARDQDVV